VVSQGGTGDPGTRINNRPVPRPPWGPRALAQQRSSNTKRNRYQILPNATVGKHAELSSYSYCYSYWPVDLNFSQISPKDQGKASAFINNKMAFNCFDQLNDSNEH
jgi:hypothetical protein